MHSVCVLSPAKLNLFLHITGRRENGYHELQTIFQLISLYDELEFTKTTDGHVSLTTDLSNVALTDNLIYKAAIALKPYCESQHGCKIYLKKNIPMGAGLGGGSSNAATTLLVLNTLWQCNLSQAELITIGSKLGADVPIFIYGKNAWAEGIGEIITPIPTLPLMHYLILKPDCFISTQVLFSQKTLTRNSKPTKFAAYQENQNTFGNNFELLARNLYPEVEEAFQYLNKYGKAKLTGTGACVFIEIDFDVDIDTLIASAPCAAYVAHSLDQSPVLDTIKSI